MTLSGRARDLVLASAFLFLVGGLILVGWARGDAESSLDRLAPAPAMALPRIDGGTATLAALRGRVVVVNIWATWCPPCVREMPSLQRVYERYGDQGLEVLAIAVDDRPGERQPDGRIEGLVSEFVEEYGLTFPVAVDPTGNTEARFGTEYLPTTVLIDREGWIRVREIGGRDWDQDPYIGMIESLLEEDASW